MRWTSSLNTALLCAAVLGISACSESGDTNPSVQPQTGLPVQSEAPRNAAELVEHARVLYDRSATLGFAWVATRSQLDAAAAALSAGEEAAARTAAQEAIALAKASISQAEREAVAWQDRMPFNQPSAQPSN